MKKIIVLTLLFMALIPMVQGQSDTTDEALENRVKQLEKALEEDQAALQEKIAKLQAELAALKAQKEAKQKQLQAQKAAQDTTQKSKKKLDKVTDLGIIQIHYYDNNPEDTTDGSVSIEIGSRGAHIKQNGEKKPRKTTTKFLLADIGFNNYLNQGSLSLPDNLAGFELEPGKSVHFALHFIEKRTRLMPGLGLHYGLSMDYNNFRFDNNVTLQKNDSLRTVGAQVLPFSVRKSKLTVNYITVPIRLQYESNPRYRGKSFRLAAGGFVGYLTNSYTKVVSEEEGKQKNRDSFYLERFRYGLSARVGYGRLTLYGNYSLSPMFQEGRGPDFNTVSFGLALIGF